MLRVAVGCCSWLRVGCLLAVAVNVRCLLCVVCAVCCLSCVVNCVLTVSVVRKALLLLRCLSVVVCWRLLSVVCYVLLAGVGAVCSF